jgi:hypothetical protein
MDAANGMEPEKALTIHFGGIDEPGRNETIEATASAQMMPWSYEYKYSSNFANAASDGVGIVIVAAPVLAQAIFSGAAEAFFENVASRLLALFKSSDGSLSMESAQQSAEYALMHQVGFSKADLRQILGKNQDDGSYMFLFHDERTGDDHSVVIGESGAVAHANLTALAKSLDRLREREKEYR